MHKGMPKSATAWMTFWSYLPTGLTCPLAAPLVHPPHSPDSGNLSSTGVRAEPSPEPHSPSGESELQAVEGCGGINLERHQQHKRQLSLPEVELREESDSAQKPSRQKRAPQPLVILPAPPNAHTCPNLASPC